MAAATENGTIRLRLLFVDDGDYHDEKVELPAAGIDGYERLIDFVREDPEVLKHLHIDMDRLCAAYRLSE